MRNQVLDFIISQTKQNVEFLASQGALSPDEKLQIIQKLDIAQSAQILGAQTIGDPTNESSTTKENHSITGSQTITQKTYSPPSGPPPSNGFLFRARAIWGYNENRESNDLSFKPGDTIEVITETNADWWLGRVSGRQGLFPSAYVEKMRAPSPPSRMPPPHTSAYQPSYGQPVPPFPAPTAPSYTPGPYPPGPPYQPPAPAAYGYPGPTNQGYAAHPPGPPPGPQAPIPPPQGNVAVQQSQEPPKQHKLGGNLGSTAC